MCVCSLPLTPSLTSLSTEVLELGNAKEQDGIVSVTKHFSNAPLEVSKMAGNLQTGGVSAREGASVVQPTGNQDDTIGNDDESTTAISISSIKISRESSSKGKEGKGAFGSGAEEITGTSLSNVKISRESAGLGQSSSSRVVSSTSSASQTSRVISRAETKTETTNGKNQASISREDTSTLRTDGATSLVKAATNRRVGGRGRARQQAE